MQLYAKYNFDILNTDIMKHISIQEKNRSYWTT